MTWFDRVIRGGDVVADGTVRRLDIGIRAGHIAALLEPDVPASADEEIDATDLLVTPGGIDTHTHIDWPYDDKRTVDGAAGASRAALLGGTTTVVDFVPPGAPGYDLRAACHDRADLLADGIAVDFALHPILPDGSPSILAALPAVIGDGFTSFKMYTTYEDRRVDDGAAWRLMQVIAAHGGLPGFHAENHELLEATLRTQVAAGSLSPQDYPLSRPALAEAEAIGMVALYARRIGVPVYIFHVSGREALEAVEAARLAGSVVFAETCTHYLVHDDGVFTGPDPWRFVISPPIRSTADRDALWAGVANGSIASVGSDHCAYATASKTQRVDDHRHVPAGAPGIEARTPLLWSEGLRARGLAPATLAAASSARAAAVLGLADKGRIAVGLDADLVLWDRDVEWTGDALTTSSLDTFSLYSDVKGRGLPRHVLLRGEVAVRDGRLVAADSHGRFIRRAPNRRP
jgi:dihydropyrimidinase